MYWCFCSKPTIQTNYNTCMLIAKLLENYVILLCIFSSPYNFALVVLDRTSYLSNINHLLGREVANIRILEEAGYAVATVSWKPSLYFCVIRAY